MTVQPHSRPYHPEYGLLRIFLRGHGYTSQAATAIVTHVVREGTIEGAPGLEPVDYEGAETVYVDGMEAICSCDPAWDEHATGQGFDDALPFAPTYIDLESLLRAGCPPVPPGPDPTREECEAIVASWDLHHDREMARIEAERPEPLVSEFEPSEEDWAEYRHIFDQLDREQLRGLVSGGSPEADDDFPRVKTQAEHMRDLAEWIRDLF